MVLDDHVHNMNYIGKYIFSKNTKANKCKQTQIQKSIHSNFLTTASKKYKTYRY